MHRRVMFFVDGENLVCRYQAMLAKGYQPLNGIDYEGDVFVWHSDIIRNTPRDIVRVTYYTSAVGDEDKVLSISERIKKVKYHFQGPPYGVGGRFGGSKSEQHYGYIFPCVFKKVNKSTRSRLVDINITIDMLN